MLIRFKYSAYCSYNKFIHELSQIRKAILLCKSVWVVSIFVHHAVGLQSTRTLEESGAQLFQTILSSKVEQCGKLLITLI